MSDSPNHTSFLLKTAAIAVVIAAVGLAVGWQATRWASPFDVRFPRTSPIQSLRSAIRDGNGPRVESLLSQGADLTTPDEDGETPLMVAAINADAQLLQLLLDRGADPNARSRQGDPPLLRAIHD